MALYKEIRQANGVTTTYHRIALFQMTTNRQNSIAVLSYVDEASRDNEKQYERQFPYRESVTYETAYDPTMTIETAYEYLKSLPQFEGAEDV